MNLYQTESGIELGPCESESIREIPRPSYYLFPPFLNYNVNNTSVWMRFA